MLVRWKTKCIYYYIKYKRWPKSCLSIIQSNIYATECLIDPLLGWFLITLSVKWKHVNPYTMCVCLCEWPKICK